MMLRRRSQLKKKRRIQFLIVFSLFLLVLLLIIFLFKRGKPDISLTLTGENLLSWSQILSGKEQFDMSWVQQVSILSWNWITESSTSFSLEQTLQPWKLMADTQLREACEAVVKNDTFQEVKNHYTQSGTNYGCVF